MLYSEACEFLFTLPRFGEDGSVAYKPGLDRIRSILAEMGNPEDAYRSVHVAGTNGKGSTSSFLAAICTVAGLRTGLHTSPHLFDFTERMRIDGKPADHSWIVSSVERYGPLFRDVSASFFEASTALSFLFFKEREVDLAVIEVGMGGRLDATNVITPELCLITSIALDHTEQLGSTLEAVASEKAGIIKTGVPVLTTNTHPGVNGVIAIRASELDSRYENISSEVSYEMVSQSLEGSIIHVQTPTTLYSNMHVGLPGGHQIQNALLALRGAECLPLSLSEEAIRVGIANVQHYSGLRGRFQVLHRNPYVVADVAHNPAGLEALLSHVKRHSAGRIRAVFSTMRDKEIAELARLFKRFEVELELLALPVERALPPEELKTYLKKVDHTATVTTDLSDSIRRFLQAAQNNDILLITGSHRIVEKIPGGIFA